MARLYSFCARIGFRSCVHRDRRTRFLFDTAVGQTGDDFFGARFGQWFTPTNFSTIVALFASAPTVRDALSPLARCYRWIQENSTLRFTIDGRIASLEYQICDARIAHKHQDAELTIAAFCGLIRSFLGAYWRPLETHFEHSRAGYRREYQGVFSEALYFDQPINAIVLDVARLDHPMPHPDASTFARAHAWVSHQLTTLDRDDQTRSDRNSMLGLLEHVVECQCKLGDVSIAAVAKRLGRTVNGLRSDLRACRAPVR